MADMASDHSITRWIEAARSGDEEAAAELWKRYFPRLVGLAEQKLPAAARPGHDGEDVALSAFDAWVRGLREGGFPRLNDRMELWQLLATITTRKVLDRSRRARARKRAPDAGDGPTPGQPPSPIALEEVPSRELPPDIQALMADECRHLMERLGDAELEAVALGKLDGFTNEEIAAKLGRSPWAVLRMLRVIRAIWQAELEPEGADHV